MNNQLSRYDRIGLAMLKKGLVLGALAATALSTFLLFQLEEKYKIRVAGVAAVVVFIVGLAITFFAVPQVIERMRQDKALLLSDAVMHTFYSYLMMASFLPFIGPLFAKLVEKKKNPFTDGGD